MLKRGRFAAYAIVAIVAIVALASVSCGDGEGTGDTNGEATSEATDVQMPITPPGEVGTPSNEGLQELRAVESLVEDVIDALQQRSADGLRATLSEAIRATVAEEDLGRLASCVPERATVDFEGVLVDERTADTEITLLAGRPGEEPEQVMQIWRLERQPDGSWALGQLPPCPFE